MRNPLYVPLQEVHPTLIEITKEFKKIDKDIIRISGTSKLEIDTELIDKPNSED